MKHIRVTMPDGSKYDIPAEIVAGNRAKYYADKEGQESSYAGVYKEEFDFTMKDNSELIDWAENNMNWDEVEDRAVKVTESANTDFQEGWVNGHKEIINKD